MPLRLVLVALCGVGAWISGELVTEHAGPWPGTEGSSSYVGRLCGGSWDAQSGCAAVLESDWSAVDITVPSLTGGLSLSWHRVVIPVAFIGLAYFVLLGCWFLFAGPPQQWGGWYVVPLVVVAAGACGSIALLWILFFNLGASCVWCMVTHGINGLLLLGVLRLRPKLRERSGDLERRATARAEVRGSEYRVVEPSNPVFSSAQVSLTPVAAFRIVGFAVFVVAFAWMYRGAKLETRTQVARFLPYKEFVDERRNDPAFVVREFYAEPQNTLLVNSSGVDGDGQVAVPVLTIFTDFQCPHCACLASNWKHSYARHWQGPIHVSLRHLPLNKACNYSVSVDIHPNACEAGYAVEAARLQGGEEAFWKMHDLLFASSHRLGQTSYAELASTIGLDGVQLEADMDRDVVKRVVARDIALAGEIGVHTTPSVFLNGRRVPKICLNNPVFWGAISADLLHKARLAASDDTSVPTDGNAIATSRVIYP
ncbi:MAG: DsbA family protein [Planctomycetes bacterium]|nr:DsbA family protein [Planctomycetota bacterium]